MLGMSTNKRNEFELHSETQHSTYQLLYHIACSMGSFQSLATTISFRLRKILRCNCFANSDTRHKTNLAMLLGISSLLLDCKQKNCREFKFVTN